VEDIPLMIRPKLKFIAVFSLFICLFWFSVSAFNKKEETPARPNFITTSQLTSSDVMLAGYRPARSDQPDIFSKKGAGRIETTTDTLREGDSFQSLITKVFEKKDISDEFAADITKKLSRLINFRRLQPGDTLSISTDYAGRLIKCIYERGPFELYAIEPDQDGGYKVYKKDVALELRVVKLTGVVGDSLFGSFSQIGEEPRLAVAFANIFASQIDFNTESMPEDKFDLIVEKYFKQGRFIGYGRILAARYDGALKDLNAYFFKQNGGKEGRYFDAKGREIGTAFLRSPLPVIKVTSRFSYQRLHPILGSERPHLGVDLAAPIGTPVMAAADGKVEFAGWRNGFGKTVLLRHSGGVTTQYAHLSRFGNGVSAGARVRQRQVIGYVGVSGLATGPHLDYRLAVKGVFKDPFSVKFMPKSILASADLRRFNAQSANWMACLNQKDNTKKVLLVEQRKVHGPPDGWLG
jgi:murein DD-endopeptidase MepM/ murein hydrolase activator NlpD